MKNPNRRVYMMKVAAQILDAGGGFKAVAHGNSLLPFLNKLVADTVEYNSRPTTLSAFLTKNASQLCAPTRKQILAGAIQRVVR